VSNKTRSVAILDIAELAGATDCRRRSQGRRVRDHIFEAIGEGRYVTLDFGRVSAFTFSFLSAALSGVSQELAEFLRPPINLDPHAHSLIWGVCNHLPIGSAWIDRNPKGLLAARHEAEQRDEVVGAESCS